MSLSLRVKLIGIVGIAAAAFVVLIVVGTVMTRRAQDQLARIQARYLPKLEAGPQLEGRLDGLGRALQDAVAARDEEGLVATRGLLNELLGHLSAAGPAIDPADAAAFRGAVDDYYATALDVSRRLMAGETGEALLDKMSAMQAKQARAKERLEAAIAFDRTDLTAAFTAANHAEVTAARVRLITSVTCLALVVLLSFALGSSVLRSLNDLKVGLARFGRNDFSRPIPVTGNDELQAVATQANQMATSLLRMAEQRDHADWLKAALAGLAQELRGELEPQEVARRAVAFLARYLDLPAAVLHYSDADGILRPLARYAGPAALSDHNAPAGFRLGEGLVGEAAIQEQVLVVADPPADYLRVRSGLGEGTPRALVFVPLPHLRRVAGVLELASFVPWPARATEALLAVRETLAIAIEVAHARAATRALLAETQRQTAKLTEQEEELRATNEELEAQQEELRQNNHELVAQADELQAHRRRLEENNAALDEARRGLEQKAAELATVSAYKSQFLTNMSHELRTPLNSMLLLSTLLSENEGGHLTDKQVEFARTIFVAGKDLLALINQVLDLAKIEAGKHQMHLAPASPRQIATNMRLIFEQQARHKGLQLGLEIDDAVPEKIVTDPQRLEQILKNLLANAIKFTEQGRVTLRIGAPAADLALTRDDLRRDRALAFSVSDTGLGIAPENQQRVFAPFEQVDVASDRRFGGTGLGLSISRELAVLLGGELLLESVLGRGSTFTCVLPIDGPGDDADAPEPAGPATVPPGREPSRAADGLAIGHGHLSPPLPALAADRAGAPCLLVIEDDANFAGHLAEIARGRGINCLIAPDGATGLRLARARRPTGIILDVKLPDVDGWRVMEELRASPATAAIPVHFVSALDAPERGLALGAVGYLTKPATRADLQGLVESLIRQRSLRSSRILVVEGEDGGPDSPVQALAGEHLQVDRVTRARDAVERLDAEAYGCMILDLSLPDMDGLALLQTLRARLGASMPAVIVYTGRALTRAEVKTLEAYAAPIVVKEGASAGRLIEEVRLFISRLDDGPQTRGRAPTAVPHPADLRIEGRKVLLVDDDMRTVYALSALLRGKGAEVIVADNGVAAMEALNDRPDIEAILMDIMMPEMDGYEAMRRIRADSRFRDTPIIALTAKAMMGDPQKCLDAGASEYLPKPIDSDRLLSTLKARLNGGPRDRG